MSTYKHFVISAALALPFLAVASEIPAPQCPPEIVVRQDVKSPASGDWQPFASDRKHFLAGVSLSPDGYPSESCCDVPIERKKLKHGNWKITYNVGPSAWLVCGYVQTSATVAQKVPGKAARCEVTESSFPVPGQFITRCFDTPSNVKP
ncbi:MAG: hypothetical protein LBI92_01545 [Azoarcus sp.]|jgi:hypothetical protein|nr:hypothetical protein [Azoarcus sp.]